MGISPERFRVEWMSAAEGKKYAQVITEMEQTRQALGVERIKAENEAARPKLEKRLRKWREVEYIADVLQEVEIWRGNGGSNE